MRLALAIAATLLAASALQAGAVGAFVGHWAADLFAHVNSALAR